MQFKHLKMREGFVDFGSMARSLSTAVAWIIITVFTSSTTLAFEFVGTWATCGKSDATSCDDGEAGVETGRYFKDVALGDVDNDGDLDIWGVKLQHEPETLRAIGDCIFINQFDSSSPTLIDFQLFDEPGGPFPNPIDTKRTYDGEFGDIDKDGNLDLVRPDQGEIYIVFGDGTGRFDGANAIKVHDGDTIDDSVLGDINGDGYLDIVIAEYTSGATSKEVLQGVRSQYLT